MGIIYSPLSLVFSAFIMGLAYHPIGLGMLAWFGLVPLFFVYNRITDFKHFIITALIWGITYYLTIIFWLATNIGTTPIIGFISMVAAVCFLSFNIVAISIIIWFFKKKYPKKWFWLVPILWTSMEYIRSKGPLGFTWPSLANTQLDFLTLIQNAEITGMYGISCWVVFINVLIFHYLIYPYRENIFILFMMFILPWITGLWLMPNLKEEETSLLNTVIVQPNIHLYEKWGVGSENRNINSLLEQSKTAIEKEADLIVWPETATSTYILQGNDNYLRKIQNKLGGSNLIAGIPYYSYSEKIKKNYNSAVLLQSDSVKNIYHKIHLVPFAEYIPLSTYFPSLQKLNLGQANFTSGTEYTIMNVNDIPLAVMICFESTFPQISRKFVNKGAEVLIYIVNDGWYENAPEPQQHAKQAIYRAIENRRPVIRCANTGISMVINQRGNILHQIPLNEKGIIESTIQTQNKITFYTKHGDIFSQLNILLSLLFLFGFMRREK